VAIPKLQITPLMQSNSSYYDGGGKYKEQAHPASFLCLLLLPVATYLILRNSKRESLRVGETLPKVGDVSFHVSDQTFDLDSFFTAHDTRNLYITTAADAHALDIKVSL
jgi:hypothetical protein